MFSMARHALPCTWVVEDHIDVDGRAKDVMAKRSANHDCCNEIRLDGDIQGRLQDRNRKHTLYVMKTSIRKKDRKTVKPYNTARRSRGAGGTGVPVIDVLRRRFVARPVRSPASSTFPLSESLLSFEWSLDLVVPRPALFLAESESAIW